jgi:hypothetical protein
MAAGLKTIKIRFVGDAKGVTDAARKASKAVAGVAKSVATATTSISEKLAGAVSGAVDALPPQGKMIAGVLTAGLAAAAAPAIGAALSAAFLLAAGGGVLVAGIAAVAKTPKVTAAFGKLKASMFDQDTSEIEGKIAAAQERFLKAQALGSKKGMESAKYDIQKAKGELETALDFNKANKSFKDMFEPFVEPLTKIAGSLTKAFNLAKPAIERMAAVLAPVLDKMADGALEGFITKALPGIEKAVTASVPLFETLADKLPFIGESIGKFFDAISSNGDDANVFFSDFLTLIGNSIVALGKVIGWLAGFYKAVRDNLLGSKIAFIQFKLAIYGVLEDIVDAAIDAFSWLPGGVGAQLQKVKAKFVGLKNDANAQLGMIKSTVHVTVLVNWKQMGFKGPSPGQFTGRASGGPVRAGSSYLVGERGPEVVTFGSNGTVTPNRELGDAGGDTYEFHINLGDGVQKVITVNNRDLKRRTNARRAAVVA